MAAGISALREIASKGQLNTKLDAADLSRLQKWYPYYAGYPESFVSSAIRCLELDASKKIADPWNGSGTTVSVASQHGIPAIGCDLNPVAWIVAAAKLANTAEVVHATGLVDAIIDDASLRHSCVELGAHDPLRKWLSPQLAACFRQLVSACLRLLATDAKSHVCDPLDAAPPPLASFLLLAILRVARDFARPAIGSNPAWVRPQLKISQTPIEQAFTAFRDRMNGMASDLVELRVAQNFTAGVVMAGDSRALPIADNSIDAIISSPPYCTRLDYIISTRFDLAVLGFDEQSSSYTALRRRMIGTPLVRREMAIDDDAICALPKQVKRVLKQISNHPSASSQGYYYRTYAQYFLDAARSIREMKRVMKDGAIMLLVLQTSYYKEVEIDLPELYIELAQMEGMCGEVVLAQDVNRVLASINTKARQHRESRRYKEAAVAIY